MERKAHPKRPGKPSVPAQEELQRKKEGFEAGPEPWQKQPGVMSVVRAAHDVSFPATLDEIERTAGEREVYTAKDAKLPLSEVLTKLKEPRFASLEDFETAVLRHWEGIRGLTHGDESPTSQPGDTTGMGR